MYIWVAQTHTVLPGTRKEEAPESQQVAVTAAAAVTSVWTGCGNIAAIRSGYHVSVYQGDTMWRSARVPALPHPPYPATREADLKDAICVCV